MTVRSTRGRLAVTGVASALLVVACGGADDGGSSEAVVSADGGSVEVADAVPSGSAAQPETDGAGADGGGGTLTTGGVDLGGEAVEPAADIETNRFPDLVVDDVGRGKKVNLRNLVPADKPVLLWMYAPH